MMENEREDLFLDELYTPPHIDLSNEQKEEIRKTLIGLGIEKPASDMGGCQTIERKGADYD